MAAAGVLLAGETSGALATGAKDFVCVRENTKSQAPNLRETPNFNVQIGVLRVGACLVFGVWCLVFFVGCRTLPELPPADLSQPGWSTRQGQVVWKANTDAPEIAGELLLAIHPKQGIVLQFLKTPFPVVVAQTGNGGWRISFSGGREYAGQGEPPQRISWFQVPRALKDGEVDHGWSFSKTGDSNWRLENQRTGEFIEGYLRP
jgi:hypothetical protein